ncbi:MAG: cadmium-translocating P-type ATPase [Steroidobacteraceae bacterium]|jgi:Cu2+-exporting ATPase|nr:cadmium-translocating P-type ATPase [Steroidobacteraceae bacterium]
MTALATGAAAEFSLEGHWASEADGEGHAVFDAEGIRCANCARSIRSGLGQLEGVRLADVNVVNGRVSVTWDAGRTSLGAILRTVAGLGFRPVPLAGDAAATVRREERRTALKRIGLAGIGSMQVMMYAAGLYTGAFQGIDPRIAEFLKLACLLIATPVLFYSGAPILRGALHDLRRGTLGMDVTVSIALLLAYAASTFNTLRGAGEVYFDSVTMFIFFLLLGRWFEMKGRHQAASVTDALARALPATAQRLDDAGAVQKVPLAEVRVGDRLRVGSGQVIPVDGRVLSAAAVVDESLVTGESVAQRRGTGEPLLGGSINAGAALELEVGAAPHESTLHALVRLLEHAQAQRPRLGLAAERMASWFIVRILVLTALVGVAWTVVDPARAFPAVLAVLVATCPCALSLATPVAIAAATSRLARLGVLVTRSDAIEGLAHVDTVLLDKTGTLTTGAARMLEARTLGALDAPTALAIAAALEDGSKHPLAASFLPHARPGVRCGDAHEIAGAGIEGTVDGRRWRIGRPEWVAALAGRPAAADAVDAGVALGDERGLQASFALADELRADARDTVGRLGALGLELRLASGDREAPVAQAARALGIGRFAAQLRPEGKLELLRGLQRDGRRVLMIGDGINDGPVLAAADVSMAMGGGSSIAHAAGDLVLLRESLSALPGAVTVARRTLQVVRQNLRWSAIYNLAAIPLAALGLMPPWVAAIGMSLSSLLVVMNARRLVDAGGR